MNMTDVDASIVSYPELIQYHGNSGPKYLTDLCCHFRVAAADRRGLTDIRNSIMSGDSGTIPVNEQYSSCVSWIPFRSPVNCLGLSSHRFHQTKTQSMMHDGSTCSHSSRQTADFHTSGPAGS
jgi:hypothetical protein